MSTDPEFKMPFGRHRGKPVKDLPGDYLRWLGTIELRSPLKEAVKAALAWKADTTPAARSSQESRPTPPSAPSKGPQGTFPGKEAARPKRAWIPRPDDGHVDPAYAESRRAAQAIDGKDIPW